MYSYENSSKHNDIEDSGVLDRVLTCVRCWNTASPQCWKRSRGRSYTSPWWPRRYGPPSSPTLPSRPPGLGAEHHWDSRHRRRGGFASSDGFEPWGTAPPSTKVTLRSRRWRSPSSPAHVVYNYNNKWGVSIVGVLGFQSKSPRPKERWHWAIQGLHVRVQVKSMKI